ncbi:hypothetical protein HDU79_008628 [Rhizoclosmatium sp. JEL0117]|nr:hypothetical protein HDU79_008628 [Rhizoclosmatium sp. JEL0117]
MGAGAPPMRVITFISLDSKYAYDISLNWPTTIARMLLKAWKKVNWVKVGSVALGVGCIAGGVYLTMITGGAAAPIYQAMIAEMFRRGGSQFILYGMSSKETKVTENAMLIIPQSFLGALQSSLPRNIFKKLVVSGGVHFFPGGDIIKTVLDLVQQSEHLAVALKAAAFSVAQNATTNAVKGKRNMCVLEGTASAFLSGLVTSEISGTVQTNIKVETDSEVLKGLEFMGVGAISTALTTGTMVTVKSIQTLNPTLVLSAGVRMADSALSKEAILISFVNTFSDLGFSENPPPNDIFEKFGINTNAVLENLNAIGPEMSFLFGGHADDILDSDLRNTIEILTEAKNLEDAAREICQLHTVQESLAVSMLAGQLLLSQAENTPGVGHAIGGIQYALGCKERSMQTEYQATRTSALCAAVLLAPAGFGVAAALGTAVLWDVTSSGIYHENQGHVEALAKIRDYLNEGNAVKFASAVLSEGLQVLSDATPFSSFDWIQEVPVDQGIKSAFKASELPIQRNVQDLLKSSILAETASKTWHDSGSFTPQHILDPDGLHLIANVSDEFILTRKTELLKGAPSSRLEIELFCQQNNECIQIITSGDDIPFIVGNLENGKTPRQVLYSPGENGSIGHYTELIDGKPVVSASQGLNTCLSDALGIYQQDLLDSVTPENFKKLCYSQKFCMQDVEALSKIQVGGGRMQQLPEFNFNASALGKQFYENARFNDNDLNVMSDFNAGRQNPKATKEAVAQFWDSPWVEGNQLCHIVPDRVIGAGLLECTETVRQDLTAKKHVINFIKSYVDDEGRLTESLRIFDQMLSGEATSKEFLKLRANMADYELNLVNGPRRENIAQGNRLHIPLNLGDDQNVYTTRQHAIQMEAWKSLLENNVLKSSNREDWITYFGGQNNGKHLNWTHNLQNSIVLGEGVNKQKLTYDVPYFGTLKK